MSEKEKDPKQEQCFEQTVKRMLATPPQPKNACKDRRAEISDKTDHGKKLILSNE